MAKKSSIEDSVNTYRGNYCYRKCFNHDCVLSDCFKKFDDLIEKFGDAPISRKEFNTLMKNGEITICKLPFDKRKKYVSWKYFEHLNKKGTDFWDLGE